MKTHKNISFIILAIILLSGVSLLAQAPDTAWTKTYHRSNYDVCYSIQQTSDDGYILVGISHVTGTNYLEIYLIKTDPNGETLWTKAYGDTLGQEAYCVIEDTDGGYVIAGQKLFSMTLRNAYVIKTDSDGDTLWSLTYGGEENADAYYVGCTSDGGYIVTGRKYVPGQFSDIFLLKLDENGAISWLSTYGGISYEEGVYVEQTTDGGYIVAGSKDCYGDEGFNFYLLKTDANGVFEWAYDYGGTAVDMLCSAQQTTDGGYILVGDSDSFIPNSIFAVKTDSFGDILWTRTYTRETGGDYCSSVRQTTDGGYIIGGHSTVYSHRDDFCFIKTDANGDTMWVKTVGHGDDQRSNCIIQSSDGGYVLAGESAESLPTLGDYYVVKLCPDSTDIDDDSAIPFAFNMLQNYPNPFNMSTIINYSLPEAGFVRLEVFNILGQKVSELVNEHKKPGLYSFVWKADNVPSGIYFYKIQTGNFTETKKMLLLK